MRRRLAAIIGDGVLPGRADRPVGRAALVAPGSPEEIAAGNEGTAPPEGPVGSVGTYGESAAHGDAAPPLGGVNPVPPLPEPSRAPGAGRTESDAVLAPPVRPAPVLPAPSPDNYAAPPADLRARRLLIPVEGVKATELQPTFSAQRGTGTHEALDVMAPKGTPVLAVEGGEIVKLFYSVRGGKTIYQFEPSGQYCYYYAHLESYAAGLAEGQQVKAGQVIGYVGSTGNADANAPHLHFAIFKLGPEKQWWKGTPIDPYPVLTRRIGDGRRWAVDGGESRIAPGGRRIQSSILQHSETSTRVWGGSSERSEATRLAQTSHSELRTPISELIPIPHSVFRIPNVSPDSESGVGHRRGPVARRSHQRAAARAGGRSRRHDYHRPW